MRDFYGPELTLFVWGGKICPIQGAVMGSQCWNCLVVVEDVERIHCSKCSTSPLNSQVQLLAMNKGRKRLATLCQPHPLLIALTLENPVTLEWVSMDT